MSPDVVIRLRSSDIEAAPGRPGRAHAVRSNMKIVEWVGSDEADRRQLPESIGGLGGWVHGEGYDVYLGQVPNDRREHYNELAREIIRKDLRIGGDEHQASMTPVFDDGTVGGFSFRAWGDLLAAVWNTAESTAEYTYMHFYMTCIASAKPSSAPIPATTELWLDRLERTIANAPPYHVNESEETKDGFNEKEIDPEAYRPTGATGEG